MATASEKATGSVQRPEAAPTVPNNTDGTEPTTTDKVGDENPQVSGGIRTDVPVTTTIPTQSFESNIPDNPYVKEGVYDTNLVSSIDPYAPGVVGPWDDPEKGYVGVDPIYQNASDKIFEPGRTPDEKKAQQAAAKA